MSMSPTCSTSRRPDSGCGGSRLRPALGRHARVGTRPRDHEIGELEKRIGPTAEEGLSLLVSATAVGVDAALAGVIFALGPAAITDATSDPSAFRSQRSRSSSATGQATDRGYGTPRSVRRSTESVSSRSRISAFLIRGRG